MGGVDDIWDEDCPEPVEKDSELRLGKLHQIGFREGAADIKKESINAGYTEGYSESFKAGMEWGNCEGFLTVYQNLKAALMLNPTEERALKEAAQKIGEISPKDAFTTSSNVIIDSEISKRGQSIDEEVMPKRIEGGEDMSDKMAEVKLLLRQIGFR